MSEALELPLVVRALRAVGERRPYTDIRGSDGSLYMRRLWLFGGSGPNRDEERTPEVRGWSDGLIDRQVGRLAAARLHHIAREDRARDLHDHPVDFVSVVLAGWYIEKLPRHQSQHALLDQHHFKVVHRTAGSIAFRRKGDRHTIVEVSPGGAWTLFLMGRKNDSSWGFHTEHGFVHWRDYEVRP